MKSPGLQKLLISSLSLVLAVNIVFAVSPNATSVIPKHASPVFSINSNLAPSVQPINPVLLDPDYIAEDTTPSRICVLVPPEYWNETVATPYVYAINTAWYLSAIAQNVGEYILSAQDTNNSGKFWDNTSDHFTSPIPYNSLNNFCYNKNQPARPTDGFQSLRLFEGHENGDTGIAPNGSSQKVVDERKFLTVQVCRDPNYLTPENEAYVQDKRTCGGNGFATYNFGSLDEYHSLQDSGEIQIGDVVRFSIYIHNNSLYPENQNAIAHDVRMWLDTKTEPLRPRAYVRSSDNRYRPNPYTSNSSANLLDQNDVDNDNNTTEVLRTMTDTVHLISDVNFNLKPLDRGAWRYDDDLGSTLPASQNYPSLLQNGVQITRGTLGDDTPDITYTPSIWINNDEYYAEIDQIGGCFDYAGYYFFDYVAQPLPCEQLDVNWMQQWPSYEPLPVLRTDTINPHEGSPPVPVNFSDPNEGLYIVSETSSPIILNIDRNGYDGIVIWELLKDDGNGNLNPYQPTADHFCGSAWNNIQSNTCPPGAILSDGSAHNRIVTAPSLNFPYNENTFKIYNLNSDVIIRIYAPDSIETSIGIPGQEFVNTYSCREAVYTPACKDMTLAEPVTPEQLTFSTTTGTHIVVSTDPLYYNGRVTFSTNNACGVFALDADGQFNDEPTDPDGDGFFSIETAYSVNEPKEAWYNIETTESGCSDALSAENDIITIGATGDKSHFCEANFALTINSTCGDGVFDPDGADNLPNTTDDETCDDGNTTNGDGCNTSCDTESCGDGILDTDGADNLPDTNDDELCDDGNTNNNDTCDNSCNPIGDTTECGDGNIDPGEACDDGNGIDNDECSNTCGPTPTPPSCGDGNIDPGETCDDGNTDNNDTCRNNCSSCGDGTLDLGEACDDGNLMNGDGCSSICTGESTPTEEACDDIILTTSEDYLITEDNAISGEIEINATSGWTGTVHVYVCNDTTSEINCLATLDQAATINGAPNTPAGLTFTGVSDGDSIILDIENFLNHSMDIGVFTVSESTCHDEISFEYCGDEILDDTEQCDDGNNASGDGCSSLCTTEGEGNEGGTTQCQDLHIISEESITAFPYVIQIDTDPGNWGNSNNGEFIYSGPGTFQDINDLTTPAVSGSLLTDSHTVIYRGNIGDTITVYETVQTIACRDEITLTETQPVNPPDEDEDPNSTGDDGDGAGGGGDNTSGGGGGSCTGLEIIKPEGDTLGDHSGYLQIQSPKGIELENGAPSNNGPFVYTAIPEGSVQFYEINNSSIAGLVQGVQTNSVPTGGQTELTTNSKEVYYFVSDPQANLQTTPISVVVVDASDDDPNCGDTLDTFAAYDIGPKITKFGWVHPSGGNTSVSTLGDVDVNYQIKYFNNGSNITDVTITDTIGINNNARIDGTISPQNYINWSSTNDTPNTHEQSGLDLDGNGSIDPDIDTKYYGNNLGAHWIQDISDKPYASTWHGDNAQIPLCNEPVNDDVDEAGQLVDSTTHDQAGHLCHDGRIDNQNGITFHHLSENTIIHFEYEGIMNAGHFFQTCDSGAAGHSESFHNGANATPLNFAPANWPTGLYHTDETLYATCNYILTRNQGDVLFYESADTGSSLTGLPEERNRNSDGLILIRKALEGIEEMFGTGIDYNITGSKCDSESAKKPTLLSSFICEMYYDENTTTTKWKPEYINSQLKFDYLSAVEGDHTISDLTHDTLANIANTSQQSGRGEIYRFSGDLSIGATGEIPQTIHIPGGAKTLIINGDLNIRANLIYSDDANTSDHELGSIAFIVDGNINISSNVREISGIYIIRDINSSFKNIGGNVSNTQLTINGSVIGNMQPLIDTRSFVGVPRQDGGSIVIRYSNRVMRNTPPGLSDPVNMNFEEVVR